MKYVSEVGLSKEDMNIAVDLVNQDIIIRMIRRSNYSDQYKDEISRAEKVDFLLNRTASVRSKKTVKKFYKELNEKIIYIQSKLEKYNINYLEILKGNKLRELRTLFANVELEVDEFKVLPILFKCLDIDYSNNIAFMIENELYIRNRLQNELEELNKDNIKKNENIVMDEGRREIGHFKEITEVDLSIIIKDIFEHSHKMKEKFKNIVKEFEENGQHAQDNLYEMWMQWTDEEVTIIDGVLKKSMYEEVVTRDDVNDLEKLSENIMHRHLLSRLVLHLIYRRMSSQCFEEALG